MLSYELDFVTVSRGWSDSHKSGTDKLDLSGGRYWTVLVVKVIADDAGRVDDKLSRAAI
jgi:hypothetical protein